MSSLGVLDKALIAYTPTSKREAIGIGRRSGMSSLGAIEQGLLGYARFLGCDGPIVYGARELLRTTEHHDRARKWYAPPKPRAVEMQGGLRRFAPHQADLFFFWTATCRRTERPFEYTDYV